MSLHYELKRLSTEAAVGYFAAVPSRYLEPPEALAHLKAAPNDTFMRRFVIGMLGDMHPAQFEELAKRAIAEDPPEFQCLLLEACLLTPALAPHAKLFEAVDPQGLAATSPLPVLPALTRPGHEAEQAWLQVLEANRSRHEPMRTEGLPALDMPPAQRLAHISDVDCADENSSGAGCPTAGAVDAAERAMDPQDVIHTALRRLADHGRLREEEMRHESSLSPVGLQRGWRMDVAVACGALDYSMGADLTAYGKGLDLSGARVGCVVEVVERVSAFAGMYAHEGRLGMNSLPHAGEVVHGRRSALQAKAHTVLDPNALYCDRPYADEPLYWLPARDPHGGCVYVPAQCVFLFANYDEVDLFDGLDSTGLGAGDTTNLAKVQALCEVIERDAEQVVPITPERCFVPASTDPHVAALLAAYRAAGIHVAVADITSELGVPTYKAFVIDGEGTVHKGAASSLCGRRAVLSAITEVTWPFSPAGEATSEPTRPHDFHERSIDELPDLSTPGELGMATDRLRLEALLCRSGCTPLYVDITHASMGLPVIKALVPGLNQHTGFHRFGRLTPRQYAWATGSLGQSSP